MGRLRGLLILKKGPRKMWVNFIVNSVLERWGTTTKVALEVKDRLGRTWSPFSVEMHVSKYGVNKIVVCENEDSDTDDIEAFRRAVEELEDGIREIERDLGSTRADNARKALWDLVYPGHYRE